MMGCRFGLKRKNVTAEAMLVRHAENQSVQEVIYA